jgi:hypothetical protein
MARHFCLQFSSSIFVFNFRLKGAVWEVSASRAFHTLLVYTSACAQAEIKLGNPAGDHSKWGVSPFAPGFINTSTVT